MVRAPTATISGKQIYYCPAHERDPSWEAEAVRLRCEYIIEYINHWYNKPSLGICDENSFLDQVSWLVIKDQCNIR
jgi:hypothetical protein